MKNKKGFTLIELLAVILLIAIIAAVAVPKTYKYMKDKEEEETTILEDKYINAAKIYFAKEGIDSVVDGDSVTVATLLSDGLIDDTDNCATTGEIEIDLVASIIKYKFVDMTCISDKTYDD